MPAQQVHVPTFNLQFTVGHTEYVQTDDMQPHVMLLCGTDLLESFTRPGVWAPEDIEAICRDFGVVCITRPGSDAYELISSNVCTSTLPLA